MSKLNVLLAGLVAGLISLASAQAAPNDPTGLWLDQGGKAAIRIEPCGNGYCGKLDWMAEETDHDTGRPLLDSENPNPDQRHAPLCGLTILSDFHADGPAKWTGGTVYNPSSGHSFSAELSLERDGELKLRGYVLIPLLGGNERFTKVASPLPHCTTRPGAMAVAG